MLLKQNSFGVNGPENYNQYFTTRYEILEDRACRCIKISHFCPLMQKKRNNCIKKSYTVKVNITCNSFLYPESENLSWS